MVVVLGLSAGACSDGGNHPTAVVLGEAHGCALSDDGSVKCWGANNFGQLGYGDTATRAAYENSFFPLASTPINLGEGRTAAELTAGSTHTCAVLEDGSLKCWGGNDSGQLGYGDTEGRHEPAATSINLGTGRTATSVAAGQRHTCAILDDGSIKCWGASSALGYGDTMDRDEPATEPVNLGAGRTATVIAANWVNTCAILDDGTVKCWGSNSWGQLGYGDTMQREAPASMPIDLGAGRTAIAIATGTHHVCAVLDDGSAKCWGGNDSGQLGYGDTVERHAPASTSIDLGAGRTAVTIAARGDHTCALLDDATVKCWGDNGNGQLGYGDTIERQAPASAPVHLGAGRTATAIAVGAFNTCALLDDDTILCWGPNYDPSMSLDL